MNFLIYIMKSNRKQTTTKTNELQQSGQNTNVTTKHNCNVIFFGFENKEEN